MSGWTADQWMSVAMSLLAVAVCVSFAVVYHLRATWWRSEVGRNQMGFAATVAALCLYNALGTFMQGDACALLALRIFRTLVLLAVSGLMVQRIRLLLKAQRGSRPRG